MSQTVPKVVMLGWGFPPKIAGGLDTAVGELFNEFERRENVDVELVLPAEFAPEGRSNIYPVETGNGDVFTRSNKMIKTFVDRAKDADLIHTHDWFGHGPGRRASTAHDVTWICTLHSLTHDRNDDPPQREVDTEQRVVEDADHIVAVSDLTRQRIDHFYDGDSTIIHNGFPSVVDPSETDLKDELDIDGEMVFFVGRHTHQKGISHLIYAMDRLGRDDVTLVIGGSGHLTEQLKRFAKMLGVDDQTEFVGYIPDAELDDYYGSADVFVSPSKSEPFGITVVEALSAGTHVVSTDCGAAEILPDDCLVSVDRTSKEIARGISTALDRDAEPSYENRTWAAVADEYVGLYRDLHVESESPKNSPLTSSD